MTYSAKPHYELLNALRFVAALLVVAYHFGEGFATSPLDQVFNHGYLAVDFFFVLSGFVIGYSYDDRWGAITTANFFVRRLRRLHPLLVVSCIIGVVAFICQGRTTWQGEEVAFSRIATAFLLALFLVPLSSKSVYDVRGNGEMFPLNGPSWSLFFEYIGNILYAICLRRLSKWWLAAVATASGIGIVAFAVGNGSGAYHLGVGWTLADNNFLGGMLRLMYPYSVGLLIARLQREKRLPKRSILPRRAAAVCSILIVGILSMPYIGRGEPSVWNGIYDAVAVVFIFPLIVVLAIMSAAPSARSERCYRFLGDLSYPLYIVHYPFMYLFYWKVWSEGLSFTASLPYIGMVAAVALALAVLLRNVRA